MAHRRSWLITLVAALAAAILSATPAAADPTSAPAAPYCGITWGSQPKEIAWSGVEGTLSTVRAGKHDCFDRLVIDVRGPNRNGVSVRYESPLWTPDGTPVYLRGGASLYIGVPASAFDTETGELVFAPANPTELVDVTGWRTFRQVSHLGGHLLYNEFGLGVRARLPFRVIALDLDSGGTRLVIDVAHAW
ncbi:AMIN-like domain-containing (lipo)protein [Actinokineospora globicatena]|uniref:AMIN-like domain-containing protein n=1 Tax=Actinokineospora globicatena TaxID=103729 RepID=A0A9W6QTS0_9PSEU|nr:hypothetical protein [Actinokineospora globicatena]GLW95412.1 hypothetical protein Aglo03_62280 [Actinokineospora globicatena]